MDKYILFISLVIALIVLSLLACRTNKINQTNTTTSIRVGSGGGFAGLYNVYEFQENGDILKVSYYEPEKKQLIGKLEKNQTKQIFSLPSSLNLQEHLMDHPGNMTYWIEYHGTTDFTIKWGSESSKPHKNVSLFYDILLQMISKTDQTKLK